MLRRDFLQRQIEEMAKVLRYMIEKLLGRKSSDNFEDQMAALNTEFYSNCGFDIQLLMTEDLEKLFTELRANNCFDSGNIDLLADYMCALSDTCPPSAIATRAILLGNALALYEYSDATFRTYSFDRQLKIEKLRKRSQA
jgi:hypothetical protein